MYGTLLEVAAYIAAVDGNRSAASELVGEARRTAGWLGHDANLRHTAFGPGPLLDRRRQNRPVGGV